MKKIERNPLTELANICMRLLDYAAEHEDFSDIVGMGHLTFVNQMNKGISAICQIKTNYADLKSCYELEKADNEFLRGLLEDVFGDREIDSIKDDAKEDILNYAKAKIKELYGEEKE